MASVFSALSTAASSAFRSHTHSATNTSGRQQQPAEGSAASPSDTTSGTVRDNLPRRATVGTTPSAVPAAAAAVSSTPTPPPPSPIPAVATPLPSIMRSPKLPRTKTPDTQQTPIVFSTSTSDVAAASSQASSPHVTVRIQLFPHSDRPAHQADSSSRHNAYTAFSFAPVERDLVPGSILRIGRKVDRHSSTTVTRSGTTQEKSSRRGGDRSNNVASGTEDMEFDLACAPMAAFYRKRNHNEAGYDEDPTALATLHQDYLAAGPTPTLVVPSASPSPKRSKTPPPTATSAAASPPIVKRRADYVAFRSKVVSRTHAELWVGRDGTVYFRDVGSSSGTFLNRLRLSPSGKESSPYTLKNGDVVQLGVDYQGRIEEIYKCVMLKVFVTVKLPGARTVNPEKLRSAVGSLISAMNPTSAAIEAISECCICLNRLSPFQSLFLAPCSHCFHYKCVTPLLGSGVMFLCPMCRQVANLEASIADDEEEEEEDVQQGVQEGGMWMAASSSLQRSRSQRAAARAAGSSLRPDDAQMPPGILSDRRGSSSTASRKSKRGDVEKRVKMILAEAERPLPRVTASDLDALLSDTETPDPVPAIPVASGSGSGSGTPVIPTAEPATSNPSTTVGVTRPASTPSITFATNRPLPDSSQQTSFLMNSPPDSWNTTTLVRPARHQNNQPPSTATTAPTAIPGSASSASPSAHYPNMNGTTPSNNIGSILLQRQKTQVNRRHHPHHAPPNPDEQYRQQQSASQSGGGGGGGSRTTTPATSDDESSETSRAELRRLRRALEEVVDGLPEDARRRVLEGLMRDKGKARG
ncbi:hypothetical protein HKX48_002022 [Thoreauomyces humboldtii]|nr:hypothetical protein HKX48_002022 [Thoreauomyces humboldtii]